MCGRYTLIANAEAIRRLFQVEPFDERLVVPRYNIAPTQPIAVVRRGAKGRELVPMRWGFIPGFVKDPREVSLLVNARAEGIAAKPAFQYAFRRRRCLVPASGFYDWQAGGSGPKQPHLVRPADQGIVAFAGLWETWCGRDGSEIDTAAIVTVPANERLRQIHHRMPAIIAPADFEAWLSEETELAEAQALLRPAGEELLTVVPVSTRVNAAANEGPELWDTASNDTGAAEAERPRQIPLL
jgi:putative SOS response-associated peptidase YedK